jgi:telomerase reverse transcriptase
MTLERNWMTTIRAILPPPHEILFLPEFVTRYAPMVKLRSTTNKIPNVVISPLESIVVASRAKVECREPLPCLVDDVVWALVKRRDRLKRLGLDNETNVLAQGYISQSIDEQENIQMSSQMRPGVACIRPNDKVSLCKSRVFQILHEYVGDELLRTILLHSRLFLPLETKNQTHQENFILVCGPPLVSLERHLTTKKQKVGRDERGRQPNASISRFSLFYSNVYIPKVGLPTSHPFTSKPLIRSEKLLGMMTDLYNNKGGKRKNRWKRLRVSGPGICDQILRGHSKCDYHRLLNRYCPLPDIYGSDGVTLPDLVRASTPLDNIASFVISVLKQVFPSRFWGSKENFDNVVDSVRRFVYLRRHEKLSNKNLMKGIRVTKLAWLMGNKKKGSSLSRSDHQTTTALTLGVIRWVFQGFIIPLIRANFYVTESEFTSKQVLYYRKPVWSMFRALSMKKLLQKQFSKLSSHQARRLLKYHYMGFSQLRLLPKATGVRPIAQLGRPPVFYVPSVNIKKSTDNHGSLGLKRILSGDEKEHPIKRMKMDRLEKYNPTLSLHRRIRRLPSTNTVLGEVFEVLRYECAQRTRPFGAGLNGLEDFYPRYRQFILSLNRPRQSLNLGFASVDIEKCYDNINQQYLFDLLKRMISKDNYFIQQFTMFYFNDKSGELDKTTKQVVDPSHQSHQGISEKFNGVVFDSRNCNLSSKVRVLELLEEHLHSHLVVAGGRYGNRGFLQSCGISQGSKLSTMLCNLYYGDLETNLFQDLPALPSLLARLVDDFIFVATDKKSTRHFLEKMYKGKAELGVNINRDKTIVSVSTDLDSDEGTIHLKDMETELFPWCGLLFDTMSGEVFVDYSRFQGGKARDSLTVQRSGKEGEAFGDRMKSFVRPRCVSILYDSSINSFNTIVINYYQMILLGAVKAAEYLRSDSISLKPNVSFLLHLVEDLSMYTHRQIKSNLWKFRLADRNCRFVLDKNMSCWLCWRAFHDVFSYLSDFQEFSKIIFNRLSRKKTNNHPTTMEEILADGLQRFGLSEMIDYCKSKKIKKKRLKG